MAYITDEQGNRISDGQGGFVTDGIAFVEVFNQRVTLFFVAEITAFRPAAGAAGVDAVLRVSDQGYRTRSDDPGGVLSYPGLLDTAFEIDRRIALDPAQASTRSDGAVRITNLGGRFDTFVVARNVDSRRIRILAGQKVFDAVRGLYLDPPYASLVPFFAGACSSWLLAEDTLEVPLKDTSYWTSRPVQSRQYGGTGGLDGNAALAGKTVPITRGGTRELPVLNVPLVQVDTVNNIWQWTDGPGEVIAVYEGGKSVFTPAGDVDDLYFGGVAGGTFRTCKAKGLLQLGSRTANQITADVTGAFPVAGAVTTAVALAQAVLTETLGLPAEYCDVAAFGVVDGLVPYTAGFWNDGTGTGLQLVQDLLISAGARLCSNRSGTLRPYLLRRTATTPYGVRPLTPANTLSVTPIALPATLDPPPYRWRVGYGRNYTVMTSGLNASLADDPDAADRRQFLANEFRYATWSGLDVSAAWLRPGDPAPLATYLLNPLHARFVAEDHGEVWRGRPDYYTVVVPVDVAAGLDIGTAVPIRWPLGSLAQGAVGLIVGEQVRSYDATVSLEMLVINPDGGFTADFTSDFPGGTS